MKIGLSIYSLNKALQAGTISLAEAIRWIAANGSEHMEVIASVCQVDGEGWVDTVLAETGKHGIEVSAYCTGADVTKEGKEYEAELEKIRGEIELARRLGARVMRCDLTSWQRSPDTLTVEYFDRDFPRLVEACRHNADYAKQYGITVTVENHGMYLNGGERLRKLILAVDRDNFRCTLDVGNSLCVDEDPVVTLHNLLPYAAAVHFKDFYIRRDPAVFGEGPWIHTPRDYYLRGSIVGHGDVDVAGIIDRVRASGYDGYVAIEFEGMEDCLTGSKIGMDNVRRLATR